MVLSINVAVLLAVIILMRTAFCQTIFDIVGQLAQGVTQSGSP
ncbi:hypothetical protein [Streptomyces canus]|nr:hypothetical protein [Streptomyces canus]MDQ1064574.1 cell division protein FtsN [Streptomyces canus]